MQRFFIDDSLIFSKEQIHQMKVVLRMKVGSTFEGLSKSHLYKLELTSLDPFEFKVLNKEIITKENKAKITLFCCLLKGDKNELVIQKATELGIDEVVLVRSSRSIGKIEKDDVNRKLTRFNKIALEATEQSKRNYPLIIDKVIDYKDIFKFDFSKKYLCYEDEKINSFHEETFSKNDTIALIIGPEGGFSLDEVALAKDNNYKIMTLGKNILRAETASIYALSVLTFLTENNG